MRRQAERDIWHDNDYLRKLNKEWDTQKAKHYVVELPCGHGKVEMIKPQDILITCSVCQKKALITWSMGKQEVLWQPGK